MIGEARMPFGKYRSWRLADIPTAYLVWLDAATILWGGLDLDVKLELRRRMSEADAAVPVAVSGDAVMVSDMGLFAELVERGYRVCARHHHPDVGDGNPEVMVRLNRMVEDLRRQIAERQGRCAA